MGCGDQMFRYDVAQGIQLDVLQLQAVVDGVGMADGANFVVKFDQQESQVEVGRTQFQGVLQ